MKTPTIFISYNPSSDFEQTLAVRLHTTGAVHGFRMFLPDRYNSETVIDNETKVRIQESDYLIVFSTGPLSAIVKAEVEYAWEAFKDKSKIFVIYTHKKGKNLKGDITKHFTDIYIDPNKSFDKIISNEIMPKIYFKDRSEVEGENEELRKERNALLALMGIGVGLYLLSSGNS